MKIVSVPNLFDKSLKSGKFPWGYGIFLYFVSYGFMFGFLQAFFWDDWYVNFKLSSTEAHQYWKDSLGFFPTNRFVEISLLGRNPVLFHLLTFAIFFAIPVVAFNIIKQIRFISSEQRMYFTLFLLVLPINSARVSMACFRLSYSLLVFLIAWLILTHPRVTKIRYFSIPLFVFSFLAQSLIPFFVIPCAHNAYLAYEKASSKRKVKALFQFAIVLIAPIYLAVAWIFSPPSDSRREYYTPGTSGVIRAVLVLILVGLFFALSVRREIRNQTAEKLKLLYSISFVLLAFGAAAYIAAGRLVDISEWMLNFVPRASDWESRHQLLLGFGFALLFSTFIMTIISSMRKQFFIALILICVVLNVSMMQGYYFDYLKQKETISLLAQYEEISDWHSVVVIDEAVVFNARNRKVRSYEWEQLIVKAGGNKEVAVLTSTYPCSSTAKQDNAVFLLIESSRGRFTAMVKGGVGLRITAVQSKICSQ